MGGLLIVNPGSGSVRPDAGELADEARARGIRVHVLRRGDDPAEVARAADADALGMAGGDGSLAAVAGVAIERDLPFVCRSEEHTSELQSRVDLVCRLLLEKKK